MMRNDSKPELSHQVVSHRINGVTRLDRELNTKVWRREEEEKTEERREGKE